VTENYEVPAQKPPFQCDVWAGTALFSVAD